MLKNLLLSKPVKQKNVVEKYPLNCNDTSVNCVHDSDCSLFCKRNQTSLLKCMKGQCESFKLTQIPCSSTTGGKTVFYGNKLECLCTKNQLFTGKFCNIPKAYICNGGNLIKKNLTVETILKNPGNICKCTRPLTMHLIKIHPFLSVPMCLTQNEYTLYKKLTLFR